MGPAYAGYAAALGAGSDLLTLAQSAMLASKGADQISQLAKVNDATLSELKRRIAKLQGDVHALQDAKSKLAACGPTQDGNIKVTYSQGSNLPFISVRFESAAVRDRASIFFRQPNGSLRGVQNCGVPHALTRNGQTIAGQFTIACIDTLVGPGRWEVNICPTKQSSDGEFICTFTGVQRCGCGSKLVGLDAFPKYEPEYTIPVVLRASQSATITIKD